MVSLLDIIGPVMVGPSSSHTAGACRIGLLVRGLVGGTPQRARIELHGSFARTGEGHGTDKALAGGLIGFRPDDERLRDALDITEREGLDYRFEKTTLDDDAHPNTVRLTVERGEQTAQVMGSSLGAGRIRLSEIDGFPVELSGNCRRSCSSPRTPRLRRAHCRHSRRQAGEHRDDAPHAKRARRRCVHGDRVR